MSDTQTDIQDWFNQGEQEEAEDQEVVRREALEADQEAAEQRAFKGSTYDPTLDFQRLSNNLQRVYAVLLDGNPHTEDDLRPVGGSRWSGRVRDLRSPAWGPLVVTATRVDGGSGVWVYQLDRSSVTPHIHHKIINNHPDKEAPNGLELRRVAIRAAIHRAGENQLAQIEAVIQSWEDNPEHFNVEDLLED